MYVLDWMLWITLVWKLFSALTNINRDEWILEKYELKCEWDDSQALVVFEVDNDAEAHIVGGYDAS